MFHRQTRVSLEAPTRFACEAWAMAKYDSLFKFLCEAGDSPVVMTFAEIEQLVGPLPASARRSQAWWSNEGQGTQHVQARAWMNAGRDVESVDRGAELVRFSAASWRRGA